MNFTVKAAIWLLVAMVFVTSQAAANHRHHHYHQHRHVRKPFQCYACFGMKNCDRGGEQWDCAAAEKDMRPACKTEFKHIRGRKRVLERSCVDMPLEHKHNFCTSLNDGYTRECYCFNSLCNDVLDYFSAAPPSARTTTNGYGRLATLLALSAAAAGFGARHAVAV